MSDPAACTVRNPPGFANLRQTSFPALPALSAGVLDRDPMNPGYALQGGGDWSHRPLSPESFCPPRRCPGIRKLDWWRGYQRQDPVAAIHCRG